MKKLRWAMDGGFWEVDMSTPLTVEGVARPVTDDGNILPLGLSRGPRLARPKQIDFFQRFMFMPFVPSFSDTNGFSLQRVLTLPLPSFARDNWFPTLLGQFNVQKFVASIRKNGFRNESDLSSFRSISRHLSDQALYALNFCTEWLLTPEDTVVLCLEANGEDKTPRKKAILHHKFPEHNLTMEAASPGLFTDPSGKYWDIPLIMAMDLASVDSDSGTSYRFCINHTAGSPRQCDGKPIIGRTPACLLPGLCAKFALSFKKNFNIWRSEAPKTKLVQPYDIFISNPHITASALLGTVMAASLGENSLRAQVEDESFGFRAKGANSAALADLFASVSLTAQHGNFQKFFLDLTRFHARLDIPSGSKFLNGASQMAFDLYNSKEPNFEAVHAICPSASLSYQQQIAGPLSFRIDTGVKLDMKKDWCFNVKDPVLALEYALQVLGSAKAVAWYSMEKREFMVELRFFET